MPDQISMFPTAKTVYKDNGSEVINVCSVCRKQAIMEPLNICSDCESTINKKEDAV